MTRVVVVPHRWKDDKQMLNFEREIQRDHMMSEFQLTSAIENPNLHQPSLNDQQCSLDINKAAVKKRHSGCTRYAHLFLFYTLLTFAGGRFRSNVS